MKIRFVIAFLFVLMGGATFAEYNCWATINGVGDYMIVSFGESGIIMSKWISLNLAPTNAPDANGRYSVRCRICYIDNQLQFPKTENERKRARAARDALGSWLEEFVFDQYVGAEYDELFSVYFDGEFVQDLNKKFPEYVADQIAEMDSADRLDINIVAIEMESEGAFRENLIRELEKSESEL